jgi:hypothetical protein
VLLLLLLLFVLWCCCFNKRERELILRLRRHVRLARGAACDAARTLPTAHTHLHRRARRLNKRWL